MDNYHLIPSWKTRYNCSNAVFQITTGLFEGTILNYEITNVIPVLDEGFVRKLPSFVDDTEKKESGSVQDTTADIISRFSTRLLLTTFGYTFPFTFWQFLDTSEPFDAMDDISTWMFEEVEDD